MNDSRKGKIYALIFLIFLVFLVVGGYFLTKKLINEKAPIDPIYEEEEEIKSSEDDKLKIDKNKDFIYFIGEDVLSETLKISYQDIIFNINNAEILELGSTLNEEMQKLRDGVKKISEQELSEEEEKNVLFKEDDIYLATYRNYTRYFYHEYASIVYDEYDFDCFIGSSYKKSYSYVINTNTGEILSKNDLMKKYNITLEEIKTKLQERLNEKDNDGENSEIDITSTLLNLEEDNYALYINKSGDLVISYIVKSIKNDYNDVIILN